MQDFTCPFSARLWRRLMEDVKPKYVDTGKLRIAFHHQVQVRAPRGSGSAARSTQGSTHAGEHARTHAASARLAAAGHSFA